MPVEKWSEKIVVVHLADDPQMTEELESLEESIGQTPMHSVLDFGAVHFVNSSNIAKLLKLRKNLVGKDSRLILCGVNNQVWGALLVTGLDKVFEFSASVSNALATLQMEQSDERAARPKKDAGTR